MYEGSIRDLVLRGRKGDKLSLKDIEKIKLLYSEGEWTIIELAKLYKVNKSTISRIIREERWKNL